MSVASYDMCFVHLQCTFEISMFHHANMAQRLIVPKVDKQRETDGMSMSDGHVLERKNSVRMYLLPA